MYECLFVVCLIDWLIDVCRIDEAVGVVGSERRRRRVLSGAARDGGLCLLYENWDMWIW